MNQKLKKTLKIISAIVIVLAVVAGIVLWLLYPVQTKQYLNTAWEWLNKPLPIVGVSTVVVLFFVWRLFAASSFGKKQINEFRRTNEDVIKQFEVVKAHYVEIIQYYEKRAEELEAHMIKQDAVIKEMCDNTPNKKIKAIGEKYYGGKEETND